MSKRLNGGGAIGEELDDRSAKRMKLPNDHADATEETEESTTQRGLECLRSLRKTADKTGRLIATHFLTLPNKKEYPEYYQVTRMPIALDTIEDKLNKREFPNLTTLESYFKRMVNNAKEFNEKGSLVHEDAERLRKALSNFMTKHNPAYKTIPGYAPFPTPIEDIENDAEEDEAETDDEETKPKARGRPPKNAQARSSATPAVVDPKSSTFKFEGLTFQQAQEMIVNELIVAKEIDGDEFAYFDPFLELPSRKDYPDYYNIIAHPLALKDLRSSVKGVKGKAAATGISEFRSWAAFEEEVSYIWKNAMTYNDDGSAFFNLAKEFQKFFGNIFQQAKAAVLEPPGTKLKLNVNSSATPKIKLKLNSRGSPAPSPAPQATAQPVSHTNGSNGTVANGTLRRNPFGGSSTPGPGIESLERARSGSAAVASPALSNAAPVKHEDARNSPAISSPYNGVRTPSQVSTPGLSSVGMAPPATPGLPNTYSQSGYAQSFDHRPQYIVATKPSFKSKWRTPGKDASDALITNLKIETHPGIQVTQKFSYDVKPQNDLAQQSVTINLSADHYYMQFKPSISPSLAGRQWRIFATLNSTRLPALPINPGGQLDARNPLYDARITPDQVNRVEIELIAALPMGDGKTHGQEVELEKITVFINIMK